MSGPHSSVGASRKFSFEPRGVAFVRAQPTGGPVRLLDPVAQFEPPRPTRRRIGELSSNLHCSIIGTCLTTGALKKIVARASGLSLQGLSDHEIHMKGVRLASDAVGARLIQKSLDREHETAIRLFGRATQSSEIINLWEDARGRGDIPGAYWAALTHPLATEQTCKVVFGDIHMLSHLVGAANRADIRRLAQLEAENVALSDKIRRQESQLRSAILSRDAEIARLGRLVAEQSFSPAATEKGLETDTLRELVARLQRRLDAESARLSKLAADRDRYRGERDEAAANREDSRKREEQLLGELAAIEDHLSMDGDVSARPVAEHERIVLFVGGRNGSVRHLRAAARSHGVELLHHDGGKEDSTSLLPGLIGRADRVMFPVDFVSHDAALTIKRFCKQASKRYVALPRAGIGCFLRALNG